MIHLAGFLEVICKALNLAGLAFAAGGIAFVLAVLQPVGGKPLVEPVAVKRSLCLVAIGAVLVVLARGAAILVEPWAMADELGRWPLSAFLETGFARAGMGQAAAGFTLAALAAWQHSHPGSRAGWVLVTMAATVLMASGAWLVHAVSRLDHVASLMAATVLHQMGAAIWVGGTIHLVLLWRQLRNSPAGRQLWPRAVARFSPLAMTAVAITLSAGVYLSQQYISGLRGLVGTAYGAMVLTKVGLLASALFLGWLNFIAVRRRRNNGETQGMTERVPPCVEAEAAIGLIILLAAAALTSQPPAIDVLSQSTSPSEVLAIFAPKVPQLVPPPYREMQAVSASSFDPYSITGKLDRWQSNFNHNICGILVLLIGLAALLDRSGKTRWMRHWPLLFLLLAAFMLIIAEPNGWPLGTEGFWETMVVPGVIQHRLATFLVGGLALLEWRVQVGGLAETRWRFAFPLLCLTGGALLLTHSHSVFAIKWAFLIEVSHNTIGLLAVLIGVGRWLELRLPSPVSRYPAFLWPVCLMLVGLVLVFYRET